MRCLYCQNFRWSQGGEGRAYETEALARIFLSLQEAGCHNVNLVSPTPYLPQIVEALGVAEKDGFGLPLVYNTSGFERVETLAGLEGLADVYLTDLRYARAETAAEGSGTPAYVEASRSAFREMWRQAGPLRTDGAGVAVGGVICRLLVLPGRAGEAVENLRWLAENAGTGAAVSVMAQYLPLHRAGRCPGWDRRITETEYEEVCEEVRRLGFREGWIQDFGQEPARELVGAEMEGARP
jgi:putative pyruvate formate lyase activating enzyme